MTPVRRKFATPFSRLSTVVNLTDDDLRNPIRTPDRMARTMSIAGLTGDDLMSPDRLTERIAEKLNIAPLPLVPIPPSPPGLFSIDDDFDFGGARSVMRKVLDRYFDPEARVPGLTGPDPARALRRGVRPFRCHDGRRRIGF